MALYAGWDTSNYTTSVALMDSENNRTLLQGKLLPVREGTLGLRQSDAVFHHVRQLPEVTRALYDRLNAEETDPIVAVGASEKPCESEGSYMPCFLVGSGAARQLAAALRVPYYGFTHQQGHIAAALYGAGCLDWRETKFLAFHVSGGTTDLLLVQPDEQSVISCACVAKSLDLKAGQLIDRVGGMLGLPFPAGPALEQLAKTASGTYRVRPSIQEGNCHLSGVENQCRDRLARGEEPAEVALFCLESVDAALTGMLKEAFAVYGSLPLLCAGGVMSNQRLKQSLQGRFGGRFAPPELSRDNAVGIACLTRLRHERTEGGRL